MTLPTKVFAPERVRAEVELFCVTPVTLVPMTELIKTLPVPLPELVIVPVLLAELPEIVMPFAVALSLLMTRLPVPVMPPVTDRFAVLPLWLLTSVVPPLLTVKAVVEIVKFDVELFCVIRLTFDPTPPLSVTFPAPLPELVIVPVLLTVEDNVIGPVLAVFSVRFAVPALLIAPATVRLFGVVEPIVLSLANVTAPV